MVRECLYVLGEVSNQNVYELCIWCLFDKVIQVPACGKASQLRSKKENKKNQEKNLANKKYLLVGQCLHSGAKI